MTHKEQEAARALADAIKAAEAAGVACDEAGCDGAAVLGCIEEAIEQLRWAKRAVEGRV